MVNSTETLKLALDMLELCNGAETVDGVVLYTDKEIASIKEALAQPEQEPVKMVAYNCTCGRTMKFESVHGVVAPQRTWVGLAAEDRLTAKYMQDAPDGIEAVIDYIEAKLKQKNGYAEENT